MIKDIFLSGRAQTFPSLNSNLLEIQLLCLWFLYLKFTVSLVLSSHPSGSSFHPIILVLADCNLAGWFLMGWLNDPLKIEVRFCLSSAPNPATESISAGELKF